LGDKNSESDIFFPPPKSEYIFQQHWESEYFFRIKPYPPPPEEKWSVPFDKIKAANGIQQRSYISFFWSGVCVFGSFVKCSRV
jgi:hypothetical protein